MRECYLSSHGVKENGIESGEIWYVANEYHNDHGIPYFTITRDKNNALLFESENRAEDFNKKYMLLGNLDEDTKYKIVY